MGCAGCRSIPPCCRFGIWSIPSSSFLLFFFDLSTAGPAGGFFLFWYCRRVVDDGGVVMVGEERVCWFLLSASLFLWWLFTITGDSARISTHTQPDTYECCFEKPLEFDTRLCFVFFGVPLNLIRLLGMHSSISIRDWALWTRLCLYRSGESEMLVQLLQTLVLIRLNSSRWWIYLFGNENK